MNYPLYQVDAFSSQLFAGNPAAVVPLDAWPDDAILQSIAAENNLSETAYFLPAADGAFELRWFTPAIEVDLCGHATLACAHVLFEHLGATGDSMTFNSRSGQLRVARSASGLTLDFPAYLVQPATVDDAVSVALGGAPREALQARGAPMLLYVYPTRSAVAALAPDFSALLRATDQRIIATAPGEGCDFVSRFFAPGAGIDEDPVTGSAHCALVPYWAARLGRPVLSARQISARGGELQCELRGDRVYLTGRAVTYLRGEIIL